MSLAIAFYRCFSRFHDIQHSLTPPCVHRPRACSREHQAKVVNLTVVGAPCSSLLGGVCNSSKGLAFPVSLFRCSTKHNLDATLGSDVGMPTIRAGFLPSQISTAGPLHRNTLVGDWTDLWESISGAKLQGGLAGWRVDTGAAGGPAIDLQGPAVFGCLLLFFMWEKCFERSERLRLSAGRVRCRGCVWMLPPP